MKKQNKKKSAPKSRMVAGRSQDLAWREDAIENLFALYWEECEPDNPDRYDDHEPTLEDKRKRLKRTWDSVFAPLQAHGVFEILFPTREEATYSAVYDLFRPFILSGITDRDALEEPTVALDRANAIKRDR